MRVELLGMDICGDTSFNCQPYSQYPIVPPILTYQNLEFSLRTAPLPVSFSSSSFSEGHLQVLPGSTTSWVCCAMTQSCHTAKHRLSGWTSSSHPQTQSKNKPPPTPECRQRKKDLNRMSVHTRSSALPEISVVQRVGKRSWKETNMIL